jgi:hypothetical protein
MVSETKELKKRDGVNADRKSSRPFWKLSFQHWNVPCSVNGASRLLRRLEVDRVARQAG